MAERYFMSLIYVIGLIVCLDFVFKPQVTYIKKAILILVYALLHFFLISDGMYDLNKYMLVLIGIVIMDWLMSCWIYGKIELNLLFYTTIYFGFYLVGQNIVMYVFHQVPHLSIIHMIMNVFIVCLFCMLYRMKWLPQKDILSQHAHVFSLINTFVLLIFMIFYSFQVLTLRIEYVVLIYSMLIVLWLYLLYVMNQAFVLNEEKAELMLMDLYNQNVEQYIHYYLQDNDKFKKVKHDFKNHLLVLKRLNDVKEVNQYIDQILGDVQKIQTYQTYGNIYVDACMNTKMQEYQQVQFVLDIHVNDLHMNGKELCSLLFNLIDNAASAANQCQGEVDISMLYNEGNLVINMQNDCLKEPDYHSHKEHHGYGMKIIQSIVDKYNGVIEYRYDQQKVYTDICLQV